MGSRPLTPRGKTMCASESQHRPPREGWRAAARFASGAISIYRMPNPVIFQYCFRSPRSQGVAVPGMAVAPFRVNLAIRRLRAPTRDRRLEERKPHRFLGPAGVARSEVLAHHGGGRIRHAPGGKYGEEGDSHRYRIPRQCLAPVARARGPGITIFFVIFIIKKIDIIN